MKIAWRLFAVAVVFLGVQTPAWATTCTGSECSIPVTATIDEIQSFDCSVQEFTVDTDGNEVPGPTGKTSMDFGSLVSAGDTCGPGGDEPCALIGAKFFKVFCGVNSAGAEYTVTQSVSDFSPTPTPPGLPPLDNAFLFVPIQAHDGVPTTDSDGNDIPGTPLIDGTLGNCEIATLGPWDWWTNSRSAGVLEALYSITDQLPAGCSPSLGTFGPVPPGAPAGTYTTQVTWTMTP